MVVNSFCVAGAQFFSCGLSLNLNISENKKQGRRYDILCPLGACDPLLFFDSNAAKFIPREGECRNMDLKVAKNVIITADNFFGVRARQQ